VNANTELEISLDLERRLLALSLSAPTLCELPIAPLRGVDDLDQLELALRRFAQIHRSTGSKLLLGSVRIMLERARFRIREAAAVERLGLRAHQVPFRTPESPPVCDKALAPAKAWALIAADGLVRWCTSCKRFRAGICARRGPQLS
jgi:hypothetical protein